MSVPAVLPGREKRILLVPGRFNAILFHLLDREAHQRHVQCATWVSLLPVFNSSTSISSVPAQSRTRGGNRFQVSCPCCRFPKRPKTLPSLYRQLPKRPPKFASQFSLGDGDRRGDAAQVLSEAFCQNAFVDPVLDDRVHAARCVGHVEGEVGKPPEGPARAKKKST